MAYHDLEPKIKDGRALYGLTFFWILWRLRTYRKGIGSLRLTGGNMGFEHEGF